MDEKLWGYLDDVEELKYFDDYVDLGYELGVDAASLYSCDDFIGRELLDSYSPYGMSRKTKIFYEDDWD